MKLLFRYGKNFELFNHDFTDDDFVTINDIDQNCDRFTNLVNQKGNSMLRRFFFAINCLYITLKKKLKTEKKSIFVHKKGHFLFMNLLNL